MNYYRSLGILVLGLLITGYTYGVYIYFMLKGENKPHPFSWIIRCSMTLLATFAQLTETKDLGVWIGIITIIIQIIVIILSFRIYRGVYGITGYDRGSLILGGGAILARISTGSPLWSVYFLCFADLIGFIPTITKSWLFPDKEHLSVYIGSVIKRSISIILINSHTIITSLYPSYLIVANGLFIIYILLRRYYCRP